MVIKFLSGIIILLYRKDDYGNVMYKSSYGKQSDIGWEVDHRHPISKGGTDSYRNAIADL